MQRFPWYSIYHTVKNLETYARDSWPSTRQVLRGRIVLASWLSFPREHTVCHEFLTRWRPHPVPCADCSYHFKSHADMVMIHDDLWASLAGAKQVDSVLCWDCMNRRARRRFKRPLQWDDIKRDVPCNRSFFKARPHLKQQLMKKKKTH